RQLVARGRSGHGSMPYGADNAAVLAAEAVLRLTRHRTTPVISALWRQYVTAHGFPDDVTARLLAPESLDDELQSFGTAARYAHAVSHLTIAPTVLRAGHKGNVIPGSAVVGLDVRLLPGQDGNAADAEIAAALGDLAGRIETEGSLYRTGSQSPASGPLFDAVERAVRRRFPRSRLLPALTGGGTDARWIRDQGGTAYGFGLFSAGWGVGEYRSIFHGDDEHIDLASLELTTSALADVVHDFLGGHAG
ncbi:MAG TPA: M20/M25/M40 family metallo-hydrolase, partial [Trebonia sp.]|nr:M20/M25/M40 family metallo-hydrolase [Trebonia sp.]